MGITHGIKRKLYSYWLFYDYPAWSNHLYYFWLSAGGIGYKSYKTYQVFMEESVAGITENGPVRYNGVEVGFIDKVELNLKNPQEVILTLRIDSKVPITTATQAI